ncbi:MAG: glycosyltransferase family 9 protein [Planctomycetes bacterium]|nr:glycosyltransferase family 9 protein [Planctomycetota bacterium]
MNLALGKTIDRWVGIPMTMFWRLADGVVGVFRKAPPPLQVERILLIKLWGLGNIVLLLPVIRALRLRYPEARIAFLTLRGNRQILAANPDVDEVMTLPLSSLLGFAGSALRTIVHLRRFGADVVVDFEQFCRISALLARASRAPQRIGLRTAGQARHLLFTAVVPYDDRQHMSLTFLGLARVLGAPDGYRPLAPTFDESHRLESASLVRRAREGGAKGPLVVMHVGSGANFVGRRWPLASFVRLGRELAKCHDAAIILTGVPDERALVESAREGIGAAAVCAVGELSVLGLAALLSREAECLFANDTAPVHLASAVGCPVFGFYGPNTPLLYGPIGVEGAVFYHRLPCSPCLTNLNAKESSCRLPVCIESISVEEVLGAYESFRGGESAGFDAGGGGLLA